MALPPPTARHPLTTRRIECHGFLRLDRMGDIEGQLLDSRGFAFHSITHGDVLPGTPVHDMRIRLTVDADMIIRAIDVAVDSAPFPSCPGVVPAYRRLVGQKISGGIS